MGSEAPALSKAAASLASAAVVLVAFAGCGGAEGVEAGATVTAYVVAPLCAEASQELSRGHGRAGDVRLHAICLPFPYEEHKLNLAVVGANARHATEDSTAVAFFEAPGKASRFSHPILETAEIPWIVSSSGEAAMAKLLKAIERAGSSGSLRAALSNELE